MDSSAILQSIFASTGIVILLILALVLNAWIFRTMKSTHDSKRIKQGTISFILILTGILTFILSLPIDKNLKGQILSFLGIIISAAIALSSTTVLGNLIAGIMNNAMDRFRNGDLINIMDLQGRVTKKGIYHTEIQLEDSNFVTIPNLFIATHPVKLTRKSNSVISTSVSLGYNEPRIKIEQALKKAAEGAGLKEPYVYITELGDFSVTYKIHGFLEDSAKFFSTHSVLNEMVIDLLHEEHIEIVSPSFMNQRRIDETIFIPPKHFAGEPEMEETAPEELIFDKAIESEKIEIKKETIQEIEKKTQDLRTSLKNEKSESKIEKIKAIITKLEETKRKIEEAIETRDAESKK